MIGAGGLAALRLNGNEQRIGEIWWRMHRDRTMPEEEVQRSRRVAEAARETEWGGRNFLRDLFLGKLRLELVHPYPDQVHERANFVAFYGKLTEFLRTRVDPAAIDERGDYPKEVIDGLAALGAFGMKIPETYGGLGFSQREYERVMMLLGSHDANLTALLSAHQSIGVPQPLKLFGTEEQKRRYLPRCAAGAISGFALTEPDVGSDPARLRCTAELTPDGKFYALNGTKLWCTNGTLAELLVVMARTPPAGAISAFVVETQWLGIEVVRRCHFMGLRALANGVIRFRDVRVPRENLIGEEGRGLKIALVTLNTGRLALPAATTGAAKRCLEVSRKWAGVRVQWGQPIGKHEAIAHKLADMAATVFAMEAMADLVSEMADKGYDIRLEAAAAKEWNTVRSWEIVDETLEIRGGRGYENERSLAARGEVPIGIERMMRDSRVNRIFEGSSEIMHLFMAREAVDKHLQIAGALIDPHRTRREKLTALLRAITFYAVWYPLLWIGWGFWPRFRAFGTLAKHVRFVDRSGRGVARALFHGMLVHRASLEKRQAFLFRAVDIAIELFAMAATISRADALARSGGPAAREAQELAQLFCRNGRRVIVQRFRALFRNDDAFKAQVGRNVLEGRASWVESGAMEFGIAAEEMRPSPGDDVPQGVEVIARRARGSVGQADRIADGHLSGVARGGFRKAGG
jgi:alkylation response protein AidB-like acyl-CoA dehydrogenase